MRKCLITAALVGSTLPGCTFIQPALVPQLEGEWSGRLEKVKAFYRDPTEDITFDAWIMTIESGTPTEDSGLMPLGGVLLVDEHGRIWQDPPSRNVTVRGNMTWKSPSPPASFDSDNRGYGVRFEPDARYDALIVRRIRASDP